MIIHFVNIKSATYSHIDLYAIDFQIIRGTPSRQDVEETLKRYDVFSFHYEPTKKIGTFYTYRGGIKVGQCLTRHNCPSHHTFKP